MQESVLSSGETSGVGATRRHGGAAARGLFNARRSDAISVASPYRKAAALVDLAEDEIGIPEQILDQSSFGSSAKLYFVFIQFNLIWSLNYFALILLNFLEVGISSGAAAAAAIKLAKRPENMNYSCKFDIPLTWKCLSAKLSVESTFKYAEKS